MTVSKTPRDYIPVNASLQKQRRWSLTLPCVFLPGWTVKQNGNVSVTECDVTAPPQSFPVVRSERRSLPQGPRVLLLAGACAAAALDRREGEAVRDQQARKQIPAQAPRARCSVRCPPSQARAIPVRLVARYIGDPSTDQRSGHSGSQQAGPHRLGGSIKRSAVSPGGKLHASLRS